MIRSFRKMASCGKPLPFNRVCLGWMRRLCLGLKLHAPLRLILHRLQGFEAHRHSSFKTPIFLQKSLFGDGSDWQFQLSLQAGFC
jgi:hypothetical protein